MFPNRPKDNYSNFNQRSSLPKQNYPNNKSTSTRCISVSKGDIKSNQLISQTATKPFTPLPPPKQLTVSI